MPIDFLCSQCQRPLRVPAALEGRETTCPHCQTMQPIPEETSDASPQPINPFASPTPAEPAATEPAPSEPTAAAPATPEAAKSRLMIPAIGVIVTVVLGLIARGIPQIMGLVREAARLIDAEQGHATGGVAGFAGGLTVTVVYVLLNFAALQSMSRALEVSSYNYVLTGFILVMIPVVTGPWCALAIPFSVWGIVVLLDDSVKSAFRSP